VTSTDAELDPGFGPRDVLISTPGRCTSRAKEVVMSNNLSSPHRGRWLLWGVVLAVVVVVVVVALVSGGGGGGGGAGGGY
jgi:hypothetical protein